MPGSLIEQHTGLGGLQLLFAIRRGISFNLPKEQGIPEGEKIQVLGVPYQIAYFAYHAPGDHSIEILPVNLGVRGATYMAKQYLTSGGEVPERISRLANLEGRFSWNPILHHLVVASALWLASQKNSK